jgi:acyl-CoA synthetase (AMP-forming)/AMP-acid ligase II
VLESDVPAAAVRATLRKSLPYYMLPSRWLKLETLPKNGNGKVDKRVLQDLFRDQTSKTAVTHT